MVRSLRIDDLTYNPSQSAINCGKAELDTCNTSVRLQSRVTSSGTRVDYLFLFLCLFLCLFVCVILFVCVFVFLFVCLFGFVTLFAFMLLLFLFNFFLSRIF